MALKTRKLQDLYIKGTELVLDDGEGEVTVWLQKINPVQHEDALRRANAARARLLTIKNVKESDQYQSLYAQVWDMGDREQLIDYLFAPEWQKRLLSREAELADEEEWKKDSYLQGLRDAWQDGMDRKYAEDPEDEEAKRVFSELERFTAVVQESLNGEREALRSQYEHFSTDELREKTLDSLIDLQGDMSWMQVYRKVELLYAVREPDHHRKQYFSDVSELDELSLETMTNLLEAYRELSVDVTNLDSSPQTEDSSPPSEPSTQEETVEHSGQRVVKV